MITTGILVHVYHLGSEDWEQLVWGDPERNELGSGAKLFECLLAEPAQGDVHVILYDGPSKLNGVTEGEHTRRFLIDMLSEVRNFPRLRVMADSLLPSEYAVFEQRVRQMTLGGRIDNTFDEIKLAAAYFHDIGAKRVLHIAAASHAPRCIQLQARARELGLIASDQLWYTVASDRAFAGTTANDVVVVEPPHRADDPLLHFQPVLSKLLRRYFSLSPQSKKLFNQQAEASLLAGPEGAESLTAPHKKIRIQ